MRMANGLTTVTSTALAALLLCSCGQGEAPVAATIGTQPSADESLTAFVDEFIQERESGRVADLSQRSFTEALQRTQQLLARLREIDRNRLAFDDQIDWRFAESILLGRELEQEQMRKWRKDPRTYLAFRSLSNLIGRPGSAEEKGDRLLTQLNLVPTQLENGKRNLAIYVPRFESLSVFMAEGARNLFAREVPAFAKTVPSRETELVAASRAAGQALDEFIAFLKNEWPKRERGDFAIGVETYNAMLKRQYLLTYDADSLFKFGWDEFNRTVKELETVAATIDPKKPWRQLADEIKREYPAPERMIEEHQNWVNKARDHILAHQLLPIPWKERVTVVPRAEYLRKTSYYGNFSRAQGPNAEGVLDGQWQINPFEPQWDPKTKNEYLVEHDWGVIIVTAPHETYGGHHVQGLYQMHNPRKLRRENGISIFSEGWGLYNEQLMQETAFFPNERIHLRQLQLRLWRNARVIWDVGIHTGKMTYEGAVSLLSDKVGFQRWAAELEVDASAEAAGYRIGYYMGMSEILKMRDEHKRKMGGRFTLSDFHERLLKVGNMPPALMREALLHGPDPSH